MQPLDPLLHNHLRLAIMALLSQFEQCTFNYLLDKTQATRGNLSVQISTLEQAGYIAVTKSFKDKKPQTLCEITNLGKEAMFAYTQALKDYLNL
jgi:DNA-binding MarR family transcriptional regulator